MSEIAALLAGIDGIKLRQSRAIARVLDRQRAAVEAGTAEAEDAGYDFAVAIVAAATDRSPAEIEELGGSILELGPAVARIMALAGFVGGGEAMPPGQSPDQVRGRGPMTPGSSPGTPTAGSGGSMPPSPPPTGTAHN